MEGTQADVKDPIPGPETALESRGDGEKDSGTPGGGTGQINAKAGGFTRDAVDPFVTIKLGFPYLWPETAAAPITLRFDYLLSGDAEREQGRFLGLGEDEQTAATYEYDCRMISLLLAVPPENVPDFPALPEPFNPEDEDHRRELKEAAYSYFYAPAEPRAKGLAFVCRRFMSRYWQKVVPRDYL